MPNGAHGGREPVQLIYLSADDAAEAVRRHGGLGVRYVRAPSPAASDDAELAAWRKAVPFMHPDSRPIGEALLRKVDELADRLRYWTEMSTQLGIKASGYRAERDDLRAKLAEAEKGGDEWRKTLTLTEQRAEAAETNAAEWGKQLRDANAKVALLERESAAYRAQQEGRSR